MQTDRLGAKAERRAFQVSACNESAHIRTLFTSRHVLHRMNKRVIYVGYTCITTRSHEQKDFKCITNIYYKRSQRIDYAHESLQ